LELFTLGVVAGENLFLGRLLVLAEMVVEQTAHWELQYHQMQLQIVVEAEAEAVEFLEAMAALALSSFAMLALNAA
jgi:hypothetical protein